jgi:ParB family chromosome partitioning protein
MKKRGLGQGLSSLLGADSLTKESAEGLKEVYTSQLFPSETQPRRVFNEDEIASLAGSIQNNGVLQPILVRKTSNTSYEIIAGERRWRAAKKIGLDRLPVLVRSLSDEEALTVALVENLQRENLNALEEAQGYERILKTGGMTQETLSGMVGKSRAHIANMCRILQLPLEVQKQVESGALSPGHAKVLIGVEGVEEIAKQIVRKKLSVRQTEKLIQKVKGGAPEESLVQFRKEMDSLGHPESNKRARYSVRNTLPQEEQDDLQKIESFLEDMMGHRVGVYVQGDRTIEVVFHLKKRSQLDTLLAKLNSIPR